jgi:WD40 repeat protein
MRCRHTKRNFTVVGVGVFVLSALGHVILCAADPVQKQSLRTIAAEGHVEGIFCVAFSPGGKRVASGGDEGEVFVWDTADWRPLLQLQAGPEQRRAHTEDVWGLAFSPDGKQLATASHDETVRIWDAENGMPLAVLRGHSFHVWGVAYSPDGKRLASAGGASNSNGKFTGGEIRVWDVAEGRSMLTMTVPAARVYCVAFSPEGTAVASGWEDGSIRVWQASDGREQFSLHGHKGEVDVVAWRPDGRQLASAASDSTVRTWDCVTRQAVRSWNGRHGTAYSADGARLVIAGRTGATIVETASGMERHRLEGAFGFSKLALSPDGKTVVWDSGAAALQVWSPQE